MANTKSHTKDAAASPKQALTTHLRHEFNPSETNWAALSFPRDPLGVTTKLRREFRDAVQRCRGSDEKFQHLLDNLEVLVAWAKAKLEDDKITNARNAEAAVARAAEAARQEVFRARIQAGPSIKVHATSTGFIEQSPRDGSILAIYDTSDDERGPVVAMAQMMIAEGRAPTSTIHIDAFGRPGIGSGQTLQQIASVATSTDAPAATGGLIGIHT